MPMRILLAVTLAFAAIWFTALRPKPADEPAPVAGSGITQAPAAAERAAAASDAAGAERQAATGEATPSTTAAPAATPATTETPAAPATSAATPPTTAAAPAPAPVAPQAPPAPAVEPDVDRVLRAIDRRKTVVLLFSGKGAEDRAARRAVARADRHDGAVSVHVAPIERLAEYDPVVRGLPVSQAPTVLVIDRDRRAQALAGLTVTREVDAAVDRALR